MAVEEFFVDGDVLDRGDGLPGLPVQHAVDQQQRVAVRQVFLDLVDVETFSVDLVLFSVSDLIVFSSSRIFSRIVARLRTMAADFSHSAFLANG